MPTLNEIKITAIKALLPGAVGTNNELQHQYLSLRGVPAGGTLGDRWMTLFAEPGKTWNEAAIAWMEGQGITGGTLNEHWYKFWEASIP